MISLRRFLLVLGILCFAAWLGGGASPRLARSGDPGTHPGAQEPPGGAAGQDRAARATAQPAAADQAQPPAEPAPPGSAGKREPGQASSEAPEEAPIKLFGKWVIPPGVADALKWANFLILFGALGWLLRKPMRRFLVSRTAQIREGLEAGRRARQEAAARLRDVEARLSGLDADVAGLQQAAGADAQGERERLRKNAEAEAARILSQAEQEMDALSKAARSELKEYAAGLAVDLAEKRVRARLTAAHQAALVREYAANLTRDLGW